MKLRDFIVCDDIRQEVGNKQTIVGVFDDSILFNVSPDERGKWPKALRLGFFIRIRLEPDDPSFDSIEAIVRFDDTEERSLGDIIQAKQSDSPNFNLVLQHGRFVIPKESTMRFVLRFYTSEDLVYELPIEDRIRVSESPLPSS